SCWSRNRTIPAAVDGDTTLRLEHQERIGAGRDALPDIGVALHEAPRASAADEHQLVAFEPPGREREIRNRRIAARLHGQLVIAVGAGSAGQRQAAKW